MIILEGPDGSGKTTLAEKLSADLGIAIARKVVSASTEPLTDLKRWTEDNLSKGFQKLIFDRHRLISEPIYGPAVRTRMDPNFCDLGWLTEAMWNFYQLNPIIVYCLPDIVTVRENVDREDTDNSVVKGRIAAIYAGYTARIAIDSARGLGRLYNYKTTRYDDLSGWVAFQLEKRGFKHDAPVRPFIPRPASAAFAEVRRQSPRPQRRTG